MKKFFTIVFSRVMYTALFVIVQVGAVLLVLRFFSEQFVYFYALCVLLSVCTGLHVLNRDINPSYKIAWLIPIMLLPIFGGLMYVMFSKTRTSKKEKLRMSDIQHRYSQAMAPHESAEEILAAIDPSAAIHSRYIDTAAGAPPYRRTQTRYLSIGEEYFSAMKEELEKAERFIFLEYFIVEEGVMWDGILDILKRKVKEGVEVRVMYDDLGCLFTLPQFYDRTLEKYGIKVCVFHRFNSILNARFNARDHKKICVIDGNVGFTGGINLADEYINQYEKHGHWKDSGVLLKGDAVWSLTVMFLSVWDYSKKENSSFSDFAPSPDYVANIEGDGFVQPYTDMPVDNELVGETVYLNLINRAERYVYITTPYLIIDNEMMMALRTAAKSGVDVRIITPGVPDKKIVNKLTKSYYGPLISDGVRIYEYTPGFIHAKNFVADDEYGVVGTINLDYRSLYLHYECAVWMYKSKAVGGIKKDYLETLEKCREITPESMKKKTLLQNIGLAVLRAFAPMM